MNVAVGQTWTSVPFATGSTTTDTYGGLWQSAPITLIEARPMVVLVDAVAQLAAAVCDLERELEASR